MSLREWMGPRSTCSGSCSRSHDQYAGNPHVSSLLSHARALFRPPPAASSAAAWSQLTRASCARSCEPLGTLAETHKLRQFRPESGVSTAPNTIGFLLASAPARKRYTGGSLSSNLVVLVLQNSRLSCSKLNLAKRRRRGRDVTS